MTKEILDNAIQNKKMLQRHLAIKLIEHDKEIKNIQLNLDYFNNIIVNTVEPVKENVKAVAESITKPIAIETDKITAFEPKKSLLKRIFSFMIFWRK